MTDLDEACLDGADGQAAAMDTDLDLYVIWSDPQRRPLVWTARETAARTKRDFIKAMGQPWVMLEARGHSIAMLQMTYCEHEPADDSPPH